mmetsp:Transcript_9880/g.24456  ORF Transcript_9880/g.24456 Transcript_9880/m.24456 type:complete len:283 (+) Transcript_9880:431-1279(+)
MAFHVVSQRSRGIKRPCVPIVLLLIDQVTEKDSLHCSVVHADPRVRGAEGDDEDEDQRPVGVIQRPPVAHLRAHRERGEGGAHAADRHLCEREQQPLSRGEHRHLPHVAHGELKGLPRALAEGGVVHRDEDVRVVRDGVHVARGAVEAAVRAALGEAAQVGREARVAVGLREVEAVLEEEAEDAAGDEQQRAQRERAGGVAQRADDRVAHDVGAAVGRERLGGGEVPPRDCAGGDAEAEVQDDLRRPEQADRVVHKEPLQPAVVAHVAVRWLARRGEEQSDP